MACICVESDSIPIHNAILGCHSQSLICVPLTYSYNTTKFAEIGYYLRRNIPYKLTLLEIWYQFRTNNVLTNMDQALDKQPQFHEKYSYAKDCTQLY